MKPLMLIVVLTLSVVGNAFCAPGVTTQVDAGETVFVNVSVLPMDAERVLAGQTVVVRGDRIVAIGPAAQIKVPAGARRIDGAGKFLMPGLAEMHGHLPPQQAAPQYVDAVLFLYLANGITTVRGMLGAPNQFELQRQAARGERWSPNLYLAGPSFSGGSIDSPAQAVERVREQKQAGWDLLKIHPGLARDEYDAMAKTAKEVGIRFAGHVPEAVGLLRALEAGQETIDHVDGYVEYLKAENAPVDEAQLADVVRRTKNAGVWIVPTMAVWETLIGAASLEKVTSFPELKYLPRQEVENWTNSHRARLADAGFDPKKAQQIAANRKRILQALHAGGVGLLLGSDAPQQFSVPGFSIHREMALMRECGISPYEILRSGTKNVGEYFKAKDSFGTVAVGQRADLILINGDPLRDLANVARRSGVMVRGRWLGEDEIQKKLAEIANAYRQGGTQ